MILMRIILPFLLLLLLCLPAAAAAPTAARTTPTITHVVVIAMENHSAVQVYGRAPYIDSLRATYGYATDYVNLLHPSLPNYLAVTGGTNNGVTSDCSPSSTCQGKGSGIFGQVSWKSYEESMPSACDHAATAGEYAVKHNPAAYYTAIAAACKTSDVALPSSPSAAAAFTFVTPNLCSDMHDCSVTTGDNWLKTWVPKFMNTTQYKAGTTAIFIWWDENTSAGPTLPFLVVSPYTHSVSYSGKIDHYAMLRTVEGLLGKPCLGSACSRTSFAAAFGL